VIVTAAASGDYDFVSRFFAPGSGIDEDPVTGSAHTALGPYWAAPLGKREFLAYQASPRGGVVKVRLEGDRVQLGGQAVTVMVGELADEVRSRTASGTIEA
jgi:predicted PhzF superfamily epimerase YddE/YHI9